MLLTAGYRSSEAIANRISHGIGELVLTECQRIIAMTGISNDRGFHVLHLATEPASKCLDEKEQEDSNDDDLERWSTLGRFVNVLAIADVVWNIGVALHFDFFFSFFLQFPGAFVALHEEKQS